MEDDMNVYALRGAVQLENDSEVQVTEKTKRLVERLLKANNIGEGDIISVHFSQTEDIRSMNPATALRTAGFHDVPLFCSQEPACRGSLPRTIRVLLTYRSSEDKKQNHIYLDGAEVLRPDL